jgi:hypothetical protein
MDVIKPGAPVRLRGGVLINVEDAPSLDERVAIIRESCRFRTEVEPWLLGLCAAEEASVIVQAPGRVRLRNGPDGALNRHLAPQIETTFMMPAEQYLHQLRTDQRCSRAAGRSTGWCRPSGTRLQARRKVRPFQARTTRPSPPTRQRSAVAHAESDRRSRPMRRQASTGDLGMGGRILTPEHEEARASCSTRTSRNHAVDGHLIARPSASDTRPTGVSFGPEEVIITAGWQAGSAYRHGARSATVITHAPLCDSGAGVGSARPVIVQLS